MVVSISNAAATARPRIHRTSMVRTRSFDSGFEPDRREVAKNVIGEDEAFKRLPPLVACYPHIASEGLSKFDELHDELQVRGRWSLGLCDRCSPPHHGRLPAPGRSVRAVERVCVAPELLSARARLRGVPGGAGRPRRQLASASAERGRSSSSSLYRREHRSISSNRYAGIYIANDDWADRENGLGSARRPPRRFPRRRRSRRDASGLPLAAPLPTVSPEPLRSRGGRSSCFHPLEGRLEVTALRRCRWRETGNGEAPRPCLLPGLDCEHVCEEGHVIQDGNPCYLQPNGAGPLHAREADARLARAA